jgi:hypothetical protein
LPCFSRTELAELLRNLITVSFHGEIELQPLPWLNPTLLIQKEAKQRGLQIGCACIFLSETTIQKGCHDLGLPCLGTMVIIYYYLLSHIK